MPHTRAQSSMRGSSSGILNVQQFIDEQPFSPYQWLILLLCFLIVATDGFDTAAIGFVAPALIKDWGIARIALGPVLSAALIGLAAGALISGPLADRLGRKRVLVGSVLLYGLLSIASSAANSISALTILRFVTGIGLGAAMPNATTLLSEYVPAKRKALLVNIMFCGFTLGASAGGFVAAALIPAHGWRSVFITGGVLPIALSFALVALPESIRFMVARSWPAQQIRRVLTRIARGRSVDASQFVLGEDRTDAGAAPLAVILSPRYRFGTSMLWLTYFMGLLVYYLLTSWMPTLVKDAGFTLQQAALVTALFPLGGGLGAITCGWLMDRFNPHRVVAATYVLTGVFVWAMGSQAGTVVPLAIMTFIAGVCMNGAQTSMPILAASYYPTHGRASGVAWMLGIGRFGGIIGAAAGGPLLQAGYGIVSILEMLAVPALIAAIALLLKDRRAVAPVEQQAAT